MAQLRGLSSVVTGGSRGLGLLIARELLQRGSEVTIAARDAHELEEAERLLHRAGGRAVRTAVCDVRDRHAVRALMEEVAGRGTGIDLVVGNAGIVQVGPVESMGVDEFRDAMDSIFFGALHTALEAMPYLRRSPAGGRLGLIGSIGGLLAVPHLLPYSCAKSAVAALAEGLREEHAREGVSVTAVHPGLMRTGSHLHAHFTGDAEKEFAWFSALAGLPVLSMNAERAAGRIVTALEHRRPRLVLTPVARVGAKVHGLAPVLTTRLSTLAARLLPRPVGTTGGGVEGREVAAAVRPDRGRLALWCSRLNERAADRLNQRGGAPAPGRNPAI
ncbi:SDR family NAD(P)-dependent oxidoreductase [Streptomyces sp. URMC 123]|uniref:SDR family NAD(P)-dependent oxidoreductase n=1 Tax=Streptomyces sp. URMC 123 TaxID=3423403 RepID=UPI003F1B780B